MDANGLPVRTSAADALELPPGFDQQVALMQEVFQRKHAELYGTSPTQPIVSQPPTNPLLAPVVSTAGIVSPEYLQSLIQLTLTQQAQQYASYQLQQQQQNNQSQEKSDSEMQPSSSGTNGNGTPNDKTAPSTPSAIRNRRAYSGSGQTISQTTRDRLKNMIATKKQKQQRLGSCGSSSGSTTNLSAVQTPTTNAPPVGSLTWVPPNVGSDANLLQQLAAAAAQQTTRIPPATQAANTAHFEPYPLPSSANTNANQMSDYQLRKVNSEPNLKMRLRARLLNKGSSPLGQHSPAPQSATATLPSAPGINPFISPQPNGRRPLQRCDSDSIPMESLLRSPIETPLTQAASTSALPLPGGFIIPSPSLPNLCQNLDQLQLDYTNLMLQSAFQSFFSMPSLFKNQLSANSIVDPMNTDYVAGTSSEGGSRPTVKFDNRSLTSPLPIGGYPSLLKQQLRDLVLRRKSLVREEPEDEQMMESLPQRLLGEAASSLLGGVSQGQQLKTGLAYDAAMSKHQCLCGENQNHVEHGGRVHSIWARLQERGLVDVCERVAMRKAAFDLLKLVHSPTYVTFFAVSPTACLKLDPSELPLKSFVQLPCGGIGVDSDTYFNDASTQLAIRVAVGTLVELSSQVAEGKLRNGFACIRPPGHHAEREQAMGFCYFNNVSIAVKNLQKSYGDVCKKIAVVDWDVHHGNGTQLCFESDPSVLYISMHRHDNGNFFPGTGAVTETGKEEGKGFTVNVPFSGDVMGDAEYLAAWRVVVLPLLDSFQPDFIFVSAGFDAARGHSSALGGYELSPQIFGYFTRTLLPFANGRVVLALEGGYDLPSICDSAEECVMALCADGGEVTRLQADVLEAVPNQAAQDTIQKVIAVHKEAWPCLTGTQGIASSELQWQTSVPPYFSQHFSTLTVQS